MESLSEGNSFKWDSRKERAAALKAAGRTTSEIAHDLELSARCIQKWASHKKFTDRVSEYVRMYRREIKDFSIASLTDRVDAKDRRWKALQQIIDSRAEAFAEIEETGGASIPGRVKIEPGMGTGLMNKAVTVVSTKDGDRVTTEFRPDLGIVSAMTALEESAAKELGQLPSRMELTGKGGGPVRVMDEPDLSGLTEAELAQLEALLVKGSGESE
ncbi:MAG: hypothetical protein P4L33_10570 [Capsulimonadaceae bacterium]|nr:hypothetical protein [Capsulimonadaceae bacterium]